MNSKSIILVLFIVSNAHAHNIFIMGYDLSKDIIQSIIPIDIPDVEQNNHLINSQNMIHDTGKYKKMYVDLQTTSDFFDFMYNYPCGDEIKEKFRNFQNSFVNVDKKSVVDKFISNSVHGTKLNFYLDYYSGVHGCNIDGSHIINLFSSNYHINYNINKMVCIINYEHMCYSTGFSQHPNYLHNTPHDMIIDLLVQIKNNPPRLANLFINTTSY